MKDLLFKILNGLKKHQNDIFLLISIILISLFSFALGFILAKKEKKEPIQIEYYNEQSSISYSFIPGRQPEMG